MENEKTIRLDFSHVMLEENIGVFTEADLSKHVGNMVHQQAGDIGLDEKARELYHNGSVEVTERMARMFLGIVGDAGLKLYVKQAVMKIIEEAINGQKE